MIDLLERLEGRKITLWIHGTGETPRSNGYTIDKDCKDAADEIRRLRAECEEAADEIERLRVDAARYRWLRAQHWSNNFIAVVRYPKSALRLGYDAPSEARLDAVIDAALSAGAVHRADHGS